jgi:hypothetical protein
MTPRRLPLRPDTMTFLRPVADPAPAPVSTVGWTRKTLAIAMHMACLGLFVLTVVLPLASAISRGELQREFKPALQALAVVRQELPPLPLPLLEVRDEIVDGYHLAAAVVLALEHDR